MTASDLTTLEADLPTTPSDIEAQQRARNASRMSPSEIVATLGQLGTLAPSELRSRPGPRGEPFVLLPE